MKAVNAGNPAVWVVSRSAVVREGLRAILLRRGFCVNVCEGVSRLRSTKKKPVDMVIVDFQTSSLQGGDLNSIWARCGNRSVVLGFDDGSSVGSVREGVRVISGLATAKDIVLAVERALADVVPCGFRPAHAGNNGTAHRDGGVGEVLTRREQEVYSLLGFGYWNRRVARELGVSVKTVETHKENLKRKLNVQSTGELLESAIQWRQERIKNQEPS